ncbi:LacI family DNA-binding transcriptional regulator [Marinomonas sp.]|uniref:LacI family DNA-binding transcriptional regulator n=1 Tax=Marinomonas sp. TaxID=1904862 RepID=UPI003BA96830
MQKNRDVTMAEVAKLSGISTSTVSRALANPEKVNKKTLAIVQEAARSLGYTPNMTARNFRKGKTTTILIVLPEYLQAGISQVILQLLENINRCLVQQGYNLMIANIGSAELSHKHILDLAFGGAIRGAIMLSPIIPKEGGRSLLQTGFPVVSAIFDLSEQGIPSVVTDERDIMKQVTLDFAQRGYRTFFFVSGPDGSYQELERYAGVQQGIEAAGLSADLLVKLGGDFGYHEGFLTGESAAELFLTLDVEKPLVLLSGDDMSLSFMSTLQRAGKSIPDDVSVVSFDNSPACEWLRPALSSIAFPYIEIAENVVASLLDLLEDKSTSVPARIMLDNTFHERESSK